MGGPGLRLAVGRAGDDFTERLFDARTVDPIDAQGLVRIVGQGELGRLAAVAGND
jgi:hypothetical protein